MKSNHLSSVYLIVGFSLCPILATPTLRNSLSLLVCNPRLCFTWCEWGYITPLKTFILLLVTFIFFFIFLVIYPNWAHIFFSTSVTYLNILITLCVYCTLLSLPLIKAIWILHILNFLPFIIYYFSNNDKWYLTGFISSTIVFKKKNLFYDLITLSLSLEFTFSWIYQAFRLDKAHKIFFGFFSFSRLSSLSEF